MEFIQLSEETKSTEFASIWVPSQCIHLVGPFDGDGDDDEHYWDRMLGSWRTDYWLATVNLADT